MEDFLMVLIAGLALSMLNCYLLITPDKFSGGPFKSDDITIYFVNSNDPEYVAYRQLGLFDRIRLFLKAPYTTTVEKGVLSYSFDIQNSQAWGCIYCLSFWSAFLIAVPVYLTTPMNTPYPLFHLAIMAINIIFHVQVVG